MIKQGTRKALKHHGTVLLVESGMGGWDDSGNIIAYLVGGDLLMITGKSNSGKIDVVNVADGRFLSLWRDWVVRHTSLAFDARDLVDEE